MKVSSFADAVGMVLVIALATTVLRRGTQAASLLRAAGESFSGVINAAQD